MLSWLTPDGLETGGFHHKCREMRDQFQDKTESMDGNHMQSAGQDPLANLVFRLSVNQDHIKLSRVLCKGEADMVNKDVT